MGADGCAVFGVGDVVTDDPCSQSGCDRRTALAAALEGGHPARCGGHDAVVQLILAEHGPLSGKGWVVALLAGLALLAAAGCWFLRGVEVIWLRLFGRRVEATVVDHIYTADENGSDHKAWVSYRLHSGELMSRVRLPDKLSDATRGERMMVHHHGRWPRRIRSVESASVIMSFMMGGYAAFLGMLLVGVGVGVY